MFIVSYTQKRSNMSMPCKTMDCYKCVMKNGVFWITALAEQYITRTYLDLVKNMSASMLASLVFCQKQINQSVNHHICNHMIVITAEIVT